MRKKRTRQTSMRRKREYRLPFARLEFARLRAEKGGKTRVKHM